MKYTLSLLFFLLFTTGASSQTEDFTKPDYQLIEKNINDKKSPYHLAKLSERYNRGDNTLTLEEKRHLYYGLSFQKNYSPYDRVYKTEAVKQILDIPGYDKKVLENFLKVSTKALKEYPFNLSLKEYRIFVFKQLGMQKEARIEDFQKSIIIDAIISTGDGITKENAFYVIDINNQYDVMDALGFRFGGEQELIGTQYNYLSLAENSYNVKGLYFEVSRLFGREE